MDALDKLVERSEIEDCMKRYARGVDRRDWDAVSACFHPYAMDHHGEFHGDPIAFIDWVRERHAGVPFCMHYLLNCLIEFGGRDVAAVETYFWAIQRRDSRDHGIDLEVFGRYIDRFEKRGGVWRVADRQVAYDSTRQTPSTHHLRRMVGVLGRRDDSDPVFGLIASVKSRSEGPDGDVHAIVEYSVDQNKLKNEP